MTAVRLHGPADMRVDEAPHPGPPGPGQVLLRVTTTCICGSDLHSYKDARIGDSVVQQPLVSRLHARVEYRPGRFVLTDLSANGTYIAGDDGSTRYLHRDSLELTGSGTLGLGEAVTAEARAIVRYEQG